LYDVTEDEMQALRQFVPEWSKTLHYFQWEMMTEH
jgi:hypothetical protein